MAEYLLKNGSEVENMLYSEWNMEEALEYAEARGEARGEKRGKAEEREELIRKFSKINTPEEIAETLQTSVEYVYSVLQNERCVCEPEHPYHVSEK